MTELPNETGKLPVAISGPKMPTLLYPWPQEALDSGLPWVWPNETAEDLNKFEPFIAARVEEAVTAAHAHFAPLIAEASTELASLRAQVRKLQEALEKIEVECLNEDTDPDDSLDHVYGIAVGALKENTDGIR